jgi:alpha-beta hydrolase superfamily lysophospholipase
VSRWDDSGTWVEEGMRRDVFFFPDAGIELYGSMYAPASVIPAVGVVFCNSWGYEADLASSLVHGVSADIAGAGGVAVNFDYPGFGDSYGDPEQVTFAAMQAAALGALAEARRRIAAPTWFLCGLMLGASVAALAAARSGAIDGLLLIQPSLRPQRYFSRLRRASRRALGGPAPEPAPGFAYGYRLSQPLLDSVTDADAAVAAALTSFTGSGAVIRHARPALAGIPKRFEQIHAPGAWRVGAKDHSALAEAGAKWLRRRCEATA